MRKLLPVVALLLLHLTLHAQQPQREPVDYNFTQLPAAPLVHSASTYQAKFVGAFDWSQIGILPSNLIDQYFLLPGYEKRSRDADFLIAIDMAPVHFIKEALRNELRDEQRFYYYEIVYELPLRYQIIDPKGSVWREENFTSFRSRRTYTSNQNSSREALEAWWREERSSVVQTLVTAQLTGLLDDLGDKLRSDLCQEERTEPLSLLTFKKAAAYGLARFDAAIISARDAVQLYNTGASQEDIQRAFAPAHLIWDETTKLYVPERSTDAALYFVAAYNLGFENLIYGNHVKALDWLDKAKSAARTENRRRQTEQLADFIRSQRDRQATQAAALAVTEAIPESPAAKASDPTQTAAPAPAATPDAIAEDVIEETNPTEISEATSEVVAETPASDLPAVEERIQAATPPPSRASTELVVEPQLPDPVVDTAKDTTSPSPLPVEEMKEEASIDTSEPVGPVAETPKEEAPTTTESAPEKEVASPALTPVLDSPQDASFRMAPVFPHTTNLSFIVSMEGDTIYGDVIHRRNETGISHLEIIDTTQDIATALFPAQIHYFSENGQSFQLLPIDASDQFGGSTMEAVKVVFGGPYASLYLHKHDHGTIDYYLYPHDGSKGVINASSYNFFPFNKMLRKTFSDCPTVVKKAKDTLYDNKEGVLIGLTRDINQCLSNKQ